MFASCPCDWTVLLHHPGFILRDLALVRRARVSALLYTVTYQEIGYKKVNVLIEYHSNGTQIQRDFWITVNNDFLINVPYIWEELVLRILKPQFAHFTHGSGKLSPTRLHFQSDAYCCSSPFGSTSGHEDSPWHHFVTPLGFSVCGVSPASMRR